MSTYKYYEDEEKKATQLGNYSPKAYQIKGESAISYGSNSRFNCDKATDAYDDKFKLTNSLVIPNPDVDIKYAGIDYKYEEGKLLEELRKYINKTYGEHYSQNNYQATEFIIDGGHGIGFTIGNILKYGQRYGHKGTPEDWRKDLMKVLHYAIIALHVHDLEYKKEI